MRATDVWPMAIAGGLILSAPAAGIDADPRTPEAAEAARSLMKQVAEAYAATPALTDEMTTSFAMPGMGEQKMKCGMRFEARNAELTGLADMFDLIVVDGTLYATTDFAKTGAVSVELGDDALAAMNSALGEQLTQISPQLIMRYGAAPDQVVSALGLGLLQEPTIVGHQMIEDEGTSLHEVLIDGSGDGTVRVHIDPESKLILRSIASGLPEGFPGTEPIVATSTFKPALLAKLDSPIAFDLGKRTTYETVDAMMMAGSGGLAAMNPSIEVGAEAPSFSLQDQDGETHSLSSYRGQVVVLDWWGIW